MRYVRYLLALMLQVILLPLLLAQQQPAQPVRLELPFKPADVDVDLIALPDSSLLLYHKTANLWKTEATFHFSKYNAQLEEVWTDTASLGADFDYMRCYTAYPYTYLVFGGDNLRDYSFVRLNYKTGDIWHKKFTVEQLDDIYEFAVLQGNFFLIGNDVKEDKPLLLHLNPKSGEATPLPSLIGQESTFSDLLADHEQNRVDVVISESNGRVSRLQVKSFDANGKLLNNYFILQREDKSLLNAELSPGDTTRKMLVGTYGARDLRFSQGFFVRPMASNLEEGKFYNLLQLRNFFKYMSPRREERTRRREQARIQAGRNLGLNHRLLLHDLILTPTGYILAAEAYVPQYGDGTSRNIRFSPAFIPQRTEYGYKRSHAIAMGFDHDGTLLWDNAMPLNGITTTYLTHLLEAQLLADGRLVMAYPDNSKIVYQLMDEDTFVDEKTELELLPYDESEKIQSTEYPGLISWYGNSMAAFGFQRVKSKGGNIREVFYINKITF